MKRFYKQVMVTADLGIMLDTRLIKTPAKQPLTLPSLKMAEAVAEEWRAQGDKIDPFSMPFTGFANAAIDRIAPDPHSFAKDLGVYGETELLCYRADTPPELVARQADYWDAWLEWARTRYDVGFTRVAGIMHRPQPPETLRRLSAALSVRDPFELAALSPLITIGGSLVMALAVLEQALPASQAFDICHLDELWQLEQWGEDYFATQTRDAHRKDFLAAADFLELHSANEPL